MASYDPYPWDSKKNLKMPWGLLYEGADEAKLWFKKVRKDGQLLYVYGIGLGAYYEPLKKWLKEDSKRHVNFIEDDYGVLHRFFETSLATKILSDPQVTLCYLNSVSGTDPVLETLFWSSVLTPFSISALKSYEVHKKTFFEDLSYKIAYDTAVKNSLVDEYLRYGEAFFRNFYPNMLNLSGAYWGNALFDKFSGVPAIICGAGPSLEKQIETLGSLKEQALIFAGGSSLNGLLSKNVLPHFGAGIDPNPTQLNRLNASQAAQIPFFYRTRMFVDAVKKIRGERLYISGAGGYDIADYYEKKFDIHAEFLDEGHNVVNFCTEIATRMGCNPIIYVGMDLAFTGMKAYSDGIDENNKVNEEALLNPQDEESRGIYRNDIYGKPVLTLWKWIAESDWLSRFSKQHPDTTFINATEGGIGFKEIPNQPLKELAKEKLKKNYPLGQQIEKAIQNAAMPQVTQEALFQATEELRASLERCIAFIDQLLLEIKKERNKEKTTGVMTSGHAALAESDLYQEPAYIYILDIFHQVFARVQNKAISQIRLNKQILGEDLLALKKLDLQEEKLIFLRNTALANISFIDIVNN